MDYNYNLWMRLNTNITRNNASPQQNTLVLHVFISSPIKIIQMIGNQAKKSLLMFTWIKNHGNIT